MKSRRKQLRRGFLGAVLLLLTPCLGAQEPTTVSLVPVEEKEVFNRIYYGARSEPVREVDHYAPISGVVESILVSPGDRIREGAVLVTLKRDEASRSYRPVEITARTSGVVTEAALEPGDPVNAGARLLTVADISAVKTVIGVSDQDIGRIRVGERVTVLGPEGSAEGRVHGIAVLPDYSTGLYDVEVRYTGGAAFRLGRFVRVELRVDSFWGIVIDRRYIERKYGKPHVWIYRDGRASLREITVGGEYGEEVSVLEGLAADERLIANSSRMLNDGDPVEIEGN
ncbi:MAG: efflux RND transporter periplasmic adaptor subunit [Spirochaetia bacterium]